jgi:hypothetical protein
MPATEPTSASTTARPAAPSPLSTGGVLGEHWPAQATDTIVEMVDKVASKTTGPIRQLGRILVIGLFAAILGVTTIVLFTILFIRLLNNYVVDGNIWAAYLIVGIVFVIAASFLASYASKAPEAEAT